MSRLLLGSQPSKLDDDHPGGDVISDQYVIVDVTDEVEDDDEMVVIVAEDVAVAHLSECSSPFKCSDDIVTVEPPAVDAVVTENEVEDDCWKDMRYVEDVDVFGGTRAKLKAGTMMMLLFTILLFDAGDLYFLLHGGRRSNVSPSHLGTSTFKVGVPVEHRRLKYVPVAAPTERATVDVDDDGEVDAPRVPSDYDSTVKHPTHRMIKNALIVSEANYYAAVHDYLQAGPPMMIPTVRRSNAMMITTHPISTETPRVHPHFTVSLFGGNDINDDSTTDGNAPTTARPSTYIPMRALIPYTTPRRVEQMYHVPSVREFDEWIPTNNWTITSSSISETDIHQDGLDSTPMAVTTIHPPDRRPWSIDVTDGSTVSTAPPLPQLSVDLTEYTFHDFITQQHEHVLVTFYFPCQRYETKFVPLWTNFTNSLALEQLPVVTATVDCDSHPNICREQGCYRFPTIRWFYKGKVHVQDYNRGRNAHKLLRFVKDTLEEFKERSDDDTEKNNAEPVRAPKLLDAGAMGVPKDTNYKTNDRMNEQHHMAKSIAFMTKQPPVALDTKSKEIYDDDYIPKTFWYSNTNSWEEPKEYMHVSAGKVNAPPPPVESIQE